MPQTVPIRGYVWCVHHNCIHDDRTDPYSDPNDRCRKTDHRSIVWRTRTGDPENKEH